MATKVMALRRDDHCSACSTDLPSGTRAQWDSTAKQVTCLVCVTSVEAIASPSVAALPLPPVLAGFAPLVPPPPPWTEPPPAVEEPELPPIDVGQAGVSARKEFERRHARRERQIEEKWGTGRIGRFAKRMSDDPQSTTAWRQGAAGEEIVAKVLADTLGDRAIVLHDRKVPKTRGNIDHLAIAPSGVWIIDAKKFTGKVEQKDVGGWFKTDLRLHVGGRDRTKSVSGLAWQVTAVRTALGDDEVAVHPSLSFVGADWPLFFRKPFRLQGVWVCWPLKLAELILAPTETPLADAEVERIARLLSAKLPANRG